MSAVLGGGEQYQSIGNAEIYGKSCFEFGTLSGWASFGEQSRYQSVDVAA
jgi:hypothetical protein